MNRVRIAITVVFVAGLIALLWLSANRNARGPAFVSHTQEIMATPITVTARAAVADEAAEIVFDIFTQHDLLMSEWKPGSPLTRVNNAAGVEPAPAPAELLAVIRRGIAIGDLTDGAFDITWAALWGLWDFKAEHPQVPASEDIRATLELVNYRAVVIDEEAGAVFLPRKGMMIGLGGIAKGTALDRAVEALRARGINDFMITAGGQVYASGERGDRPWRIGVRNPRGDANDYFAHLDVTDLSAATSADNERFFIIDGTRYHHVLDPRTGMPGKHLRSVTVFSPDAELADALSTAMMTFDPQRALTMAAALDDVEIVLVDSEGTVHVSAGLDGRLEMAANAARAR